MKKSTEKITDKRKMNLKPPWKPTQSGNPKGKPKGLRSWHTVLRERLESGKITMEQIGDAILKKAKRGDTKAIDLIWNRMDGKPKETIEVPQSPGINVLELPPELRREVLEEILKQDKKA